MRSPKNVAYIIAMLSLLCTTLPIVGYLIGSKPDHTKIKIGTNEATIRVSDDEKWVIVYADIEDLPLVYTEKDGYIFNFAKGYFDATTNWKERIPFQLITVLLAGLIALFGNNFIQRRKIVSEAIVKSEVEDLEKYLDLCNQFSAKSSQVIQVGYEYIHELRSIDDLTMHTLKLVELSDMLTVRYSKNPLISSQVAHIYEGISQILALAKKRNRPSMDEYIKRKANCQMAIAELDEIIDDHRSKSIDRIAQLI